MGSGGLDIWVSSTSFQKSNIGWPQQPLTERVLKFNMIFPYSTPIFFSSKHQSKAEFKNLDDTEVLSSDFPGVITSATSMTSMTSTTSVASMSSTASFYQKIYSTWWLDHPCHQNDQTGPFVWNGSSKIQFFTDISTISVGGCWGQLMLLFWKLVDETQMPTTPEATSYQSSRKFSTLLPTFYPSEPFI